MAGFFVSAPMANGTLTNDCVVGSLGPSWPSPCGSAPRGAAANRPSVADSASPIAPTKNTKEPARWRVFLCPRQWPTGLSPTTTSLVHSGRPGPRPYGSAPHGAAANRPSLADSASPIAPTNAVPKNPPDGGFFVARATCSDWLSPTTASLVHSGRPGPRPAGPRLTVRLRIGRPWPIRRVPSRPWRPVCGARLRCFYYCRARGRPRTVEKNA